MSDFYDYNKSRMYEKIGQENNNLFEQSDEKSFQNPIEQQYQKIEQERLQRQENQNRYGVDIPDEVYAILNNSIANGDIPEDSAYNMASAYKYSEMYGVPVDMAMNNLEYFNNLTFGTKQQSTPKGNFEAICDSWQIGKNTLKMSNLGNQLIQAEKSGNEKLIADIQQQINLLNQENSYLSDSQNRNFFIQSLKDGAQTLPYSGAVAIPGLLNVFLPGLGVAASGATSYGLAQGLEYLNLREAGATPEMARGVAFLSGGAQAATEMALGTVAKALGTDKLAKAITSKTDHIVQGVLNKVFVNSKGFKVFASKLVQGGLNTGIDALGEGTEEVLQEFESYLGVAIASQLQEETDGQINVPEFEEIIKNSVESFTAGFRSSLVLGGVASIPHKFGTIKDFQTVKEAAQTIPSKEDFVKTTADSPIFEGMSDEEKKTRQEEIYNEFEKERGEVLDRKAKDIDEVSDFQAGSEDNKIQEAEDTEEEVRGAAYRENGRLYTETDVTTDESGNVKGTFKIGNPTEETSYNRYGYIDFKEGKDNTITIEKFKLTPGRQNLAVEMFESFSEQFSDKNIIWKPKGKAGKALYKQLALNNPRGKDFGLSYFTENDTATIKDRHARLKLAKDIQTYFPNMSSAERALGVYIFESMGKSNGMGLNDYIQNTYRDGNVFADFSETGESATVIENGQKFVRKGAMTTFANDVKSIIYTTQYSDFSTLVHEAAHVFRAHMTKELLEQAEKAFGVVNGDWSAKTFKTNDGRLISCDEALAEGFEDYLRTGQAKDSALKQIYDKIAQFMARIYNWMKNETRINISPEIKNIYDQMVSGESSLAEAIAVTQKVDEQQREAYLAEQKKQQAQQKETEQKIFNDESTAEEIKEAKVEDVINSDTVAEDVKVEKILETVTDEQAEKELENINTDDIPIFQTITGEGLERLLRNNAQMQEALKKAQTYESHGYSFDDFKSGDFVFRKIGNKWAIETDDKRAYLGRKNVFDAIKKASNIKFSAMYHAALEKAQGNTEVAKEFVKTSNLIGVTVERNRFALKDVLGYKELYTAYPWMEKIPVKFISVANKPLVNITDDEIEINPFVGSFDELGPALLSKTQEILNKHQGILPSEDVFDEKLDNALKSIIDKAIITTREYEKYNDFIEASYEVVKDDLNFQIIGEMGAKALDDAEEATIRLDNLSIARQMEEQGKDALTIRLATGWERGVDEQWRYEIDDDYKLKKDINFNEDKILLSDLVDFPELFLAYPNIKNIQIEKKAMENYRGLYSPFFNKITLDENSSVDILAHEIQHAIQRIEGFAKGGNVEQFTDSRLENIRENIKEYRAILNSYDKQINLPEFRAQSLQEVVNKQKTVEKHFEDLENFRLNSNLAEMYKEINNRVKEAENLYDEISGTPSNFERDLATFSARDKDFFVNFDKEKYIKEMIDSGFTEEDIKSMYSDNNGLGSVLDYIQRRINDGKIDVLLEEIQDANEKVIHEGEIKVNDKYFPTPYDAYYSLAGEVEARNVQNRINMTSDERRKKLLQDTADVAALDQIILHQTDYTSVMQDKDAEERITAYEKTISDWINDDEKLRNLLSSAKEIHKQYVLKTLLKTSKEERKSVIKDFLSEYFIYERGKGDFYALRNLGIVKNSPEYKNIDKDLEKLGSIVFDIIDYLEKENINYRYSESEKYWGNSYYITPLREDGNSMFIEYLPLTFRISDHDYTATWRREEIDVNSLKTVKEYISRAIDYEKQLKIELEELKKQAEKKRKANLEKWDFLKSQFPNTDWYFELMDVKDGFIKNEKTKEKFKNAKIYFLLKKSEYDINKTLIYGIEKGSEKLRNNSKLIKDYLDYNILNDNIVDTSSDIIYFQSSPAEELAKIRKMYENSDSWLKAPNGNDTNLTEKQWLQVRTPQFKKWFGDWENDPENASKVVDENGEPLVVYHGTSYQFDKFVSDEIGKTTKNKGIFGNGFYFSNSNEMASYYAKFDKTKEGKVLNTYLNIRNPFVWSDNKNIEVAKNLGFPKDRIRDNKLLPITDNEKILKFTKELKDAGYDGVIYNYPKSYSGFGDNNVNETVAFYPNQIKSATDNSGDFDASNPSILFQKYDPRSFVPKVRGGWTESKIIKYLKDNPTLSGINNAIKIIKEFDNPEELKEHMFYHGTAGGSDKLKPSITMSDREIERIGGGGYGQKYWSISVSKSKEIASRFAPMSTSVRIYPIILAKNANVIEMPELSDSVELESHITELWEKGVDAVWIGDKNSGEQELSILNPRAVVNVGTPSVYKNFGLGSEKNPINVKNDAQITEMFNFAQNYIPKTAKDFGEPQKPSHFIRDENGEVIGDNTNYNSELEEYKKEYEKWIFSDDYKEWYKFDRERRNAILFQIAYHGSPHNFDNFSTSAIGTGEGAQSFGWGLYFTNQEDIARWYADKLTNTEENEEYIREIEELEKEVQLLKVIVDVYKTKLKENNLSKRIKSNIETALPDFLKKIESNEASIKLLKEKLNKRNLYTVELPDNGYLLWDKEYDAKDLTSLKQPLFNRLLDEYFGGDKESTQYEVDSIFYDGITGEELYHALQHELGSDKAASLFLKENGYIGIDYPAQSLSGNIDEGKRNYVIFDEADIKVIQHYNFHDVPEEFLDSVNDATLKEAASFETWQDFMEYYETDYVPKNIDIPQDVTAGWYQRTWELAHNLKPSESINREEYLAEELAAGDTALVDDALFMTELSGESNMLIPFLKAINYYKNTEEWQPQDAEDEQELERFRRIKNRVEYEIRHASILTNAVRVAKGKPLTDKARRTLLSLIEANVRDYRALYADIMYEDSFAVNLADTNKGKVKIANPNMDVDTMSPEQLKEIADRIEFEELANKIKKGELLMDDEINRYINMLDAQLKASDKKVKEAQKALENEKLETSQDYKRISDWQQRQLLKYYDELLEAKGKLYEKDKRNLKKAEKGLKIAEPYQLYRNRRQSDYDTIFKQFQDMAKITEITGEVKEAMAHRDALYEAKLENTKLREAATALSETREIQKKLVKRAMRKIDFKTVDYEQAVKIIAIQETFEPLLLDGLNQWIDTDNPYLRTVYYDFKTDPEFAQKLEERSERKGGKSLRYLINLMKTKDIEEWTVDEKKKARQSLPRNDYIREFGIENLGRYRKGSLQLDLQSPEIQKMLKDTLSIDLYAAISGKPFVKWTITEMAELAELIGDLYAEGKSMLRAKQEAKKQEAARIRAKIEEAIRTGGIEIPDDAPEEEKEKYRKLLEKREAEILGYESTIQGTLQSDVKRKSLRNRLRHRGYSDATILRVARILDGNKEGENTQLLYYGADEAYNSKHRHIRERQQKIEKALIDNDIKVEELYKQITIGNFYKNGKSATFTVDELLFFAEADKDRPPEDKSNNFDGGTAYEAVVYGNMASPQEKEAIRQSLMDVTLSDDDLGLVQAQYKGMCEARFERIMQLVKTLDPKFLKFAEAIADDYEKEFERMNKASIEEFNQPVWRVEKYIPLIRLGQTGEENENRVKEDLLGTSGIQNQNWVNKGMTQKRIKISPWNQRPVEIGLYKTWLDAIDRTEHFIAYSGYVRTLNRIYKSRDANGNRALMEAMYGKGMVTYIDDYINELANPTPTGQRTALDKICRTLRGKTAPAYLAWKMSGIIKQFCTSPMPYFQYLTLGEYISASYDFIKNYEELNNAIKEKSVFMNSRVMDPILDIIKEQQQKVTNKASYGLNKFNAMGMKGLEMVDWMCVAPGWLASYRKEFARLEEENANLQIARDKMYKDNLDRLIAENEKAEVYMMKTMQELEEEAKEDLPKVLSQEELERKAVSKADDITRRCQPSSRAEDLSPLFKNSGKNSELVKILLQFQTSLNVIWNNIRYDLPQAIREKNYHQIVGAVAGYAVAGIAMMLVTGEPYGDDDDDKETSLFKQILFYGTTQFTDSIPVIGSYITALNQMLITGKGGMMYSNNTFPVLNEAMGTVQSAIKGNWDKAAINFGEGVGYFLGLPVSGTKELLESAGLRDDEKGMEFNPGAFLGWRE